MSFGSRLRNNQAPKAATALTGAIGTTVAGNPMLCDAMQPGGIVGIEFGIHLETGSVTATPSAQGSVDGTNWLDLYQINDPANVAMSASGTRVLVLPGQPPFRMIRGLVTVGGATATANDTAAIKYHFVENPYPNG